MMRYNIRVKYTKITTGINGEKSYTIEDSSENEAKEQARHRCEKEGYKFLEIVSCRLMR